VNLHGGFKYTNVKRTSYGGDFVYSTNGFRDDVGNLPDGEKGITYEQRYPGLFVGGEASTRFGAWTLTGLVRGGVTINASDTDHHWMKNNRYEEEYSATPFVSVGAQLDYALSERASIFLGGSFESSSARRATRQSMTFQPVKRARLLSTRRAWTSSPPRSAPV
jgi:outer membrane protease